MAAVEPGRGADRRVAWVLYAAAVAVYADMYITQPVLPILSREYGVSPALAGLSVSAVVLAVALCSSVYGTLSDRVSRKYVMVAACALLTVPTLLCALAPNFVSLLLFRLLQGFILPGVTVVAVPYIGDHFHRGSLGRVVGNYIGASVVGGLLGRVGSGIIADLSSWHVAFLFFAAITALTGGVMFKILPYHPPHGHSHAEPSPLAGLAMHLRDRALVGAFLIGFGLFFAFIGIFTYLPYYLTHEPFNLSPGLVAFAYLSYLAGVIMAPLAGRLSVKYNRRLLMAAGLVTAALGILMTVVSVLPVVVVGLIVLNLGMFTAQSIAPAYVNARARRAKGSANAAYNTLYYAGAVVGSFLPGLACEGSGWGGVTAICLSTLALALAADIWLCRDA